MVKDGLVHGQRPPTVFKSSRAGIKKGAPALSIEAFASGRSSGYDKRAVLQQQRELKLRKLSKFKRLRKRLEADGVLPAVEPRDAVAELDSELHNEHVSESKTGKKTILSKPNGIADERPRKRHKSTLDPQVVATDCRAPSDLQDAAGAQRPSSKQYDQQEQRNSASRQETAPAQARPRSVRPLRSDSREVVAAVMPHESEHESSHSGSDGLNSGGAGSKAGPHARRSHAVAVSGHQRADKPVPQLKRLADKLADQKAAKQAKRGQIEAMHAARRASIEEAERARKKQKTAHFKRTSKGQPLMGVRIQKMLEDLQRG